MPVKAKLSKQAWNSEEFCCSLAHETPNKKKKKKNEYQLPVKTF